MLANLMAMQSSHIVQDKPLEGNSKTTKSHMGSCDTPMAMNMKVNFKTTKSQEKENIDLILETSMRVLLKMIRKMA